MRRVLSAVFAFALLTPVAAACGSDDATTGTGQVDAGPDASHADAAAPVTVTVTPGDAAPATKDAGHDAGHDAGKSGCGVAIGPSMSGEATYYDADGTGACGYPASSNFHVCAMNMDEFSRAMCGECLEVKGPDGTTTVRVTDDCPGCSEGGLDLSETAFDEIASMSAGRVDITWFVVSCPPDLASP